MSTTPTNTKAVASRTVTGVWHGGYHCTVEAGAYSIEVDEPLEVGGTALGPQPTDLFLASLASCFLLALSYAAKKQQVELVDLSVSVTGTYDGMRFSAVHVQASVGAPHEALDELVRIAERVCYVTNTLRSGLELTTEAVTTGA